ncbi:MAG TPA: hypothetical protein VEU30_09385 [Thermoanaerobaculia bacterium]|nr:hypothetical protein [Thermoanaerobaculia bacterium]
MTTNNHRLPLAIAALLLLAPLRAEATLSEAKTFDDKVDQAATIIVGRVVSTESRWDNARKWILTYNRFQVEKVLKGMPVPEVTIVTPGGAVDNVQQDTVGVPKFEVGDEHVIFVRNTQAGPTVLYFEQGAYRLLRDSRGERTVTPATSGAVLIDNQAGKIVRPEEPRLLRDFEVRVRDTMKRRDAMRMAVIKNKKTESTSIMRVLERNKALVILALIGAVLATWQLVKRW